MGILDALKAATANVQSEPTKEQPKAQAKTSAKSAPKGASAKPGASKASAKTGAKSAPKTKATAKPSCAYVIPASFKTAIEDYLNKREDMKEKMKNPEKNISGCCDYIYRTMQKRAEKERGSNQVVGMYVEPDEIFGMAVHYYDETNESLEAELKAK